MAITTEFDAKANLVVAEEALKKGKADKLSAAKIKLLEKNVKNAQTLLKTIQKALKKK